MTNSNNNLTQSQRCEDLTQSQRCNDLTQSQSCDSLTQSPVYSNLLHSLAGHRMERLPIGGKRRASVLIPLISESGWALLFEVRANNIVQGGEICFPGGGIESGESAEETAVRETMEELLIRRSQLDIVCPMFELTGPGGTEVSSYLGVLKDYKWTYSQDEVSRIFTLPLSWFAAHPAKEYRATLETKLPEDFPFDELPGGRQYPFRPVPKTFYFYETDYGPLWGMTAQIVHAALPLLSEGVPYVTDKTIQP